MNRKWIVSNKLLIWQCQPAVVEIMAFILAQTNITLLAAIDSLHPGPFLVLAYTALSTPPSL